jgi:hypothetical protein
MAGEMCQIAELQDRDEAGVAGAGPIPTVGCKYPSRRDQFVDWWRLEAWPRRHSGEEYGFDHFDAKAAVRLLDHPKVNWDLDKARKVADWYLHADERDEAKGHPLRGLADYVNHYFGEMGRDRQVRQAQERQAQERQKIERPETELAAAEVTEDVETAFDAGEVEEAIAIVAAGLRDHVPANDPLRVDLLALLPPVDADGEHMTLITAEAAGRFFESFANLPLARRRRILEGWHPDVLTLRRDEYVEHARGDNLVPCLNLTAGAERHQDANPTGTFWVSSASMRPVEMNIRAGLSKREAMASIDNLRRMVDQHWDRLIFNPMNDPPEANAEPGGKSPATTQFLFHVVGGKPKPLFPIDPEGNDVIADGVEILTAAQAAERFGVAAEVLRDDFRSHFRAVLDQEIK